MMKKIIFGLLMVVLLASCTDKTSYRIEGKAEGVADGEKVYLFSDRRGRHVLETATIEGERFVFSEKKIVENEDVLFFGADVLEEAGSTSRPMVIFIEPGVIKVTMDSLTVSDISGTPLNKKNTDFLASLGENGTEDSDQLTSFIKSNIDNALGVYYFERMLYAYDLEKTKEILSLFPDKFSDNKSLQAVEEYVKMQEKTAVGVKFTDLKALTPEGAEIALSDYAGKGKVVLVDFWASWCPPCRKDMPLLVEAYAKYKDKGFEIVGVSLDKTNEEWKEKIADLNITWPQMSDLKFWESDLAKAYAVRSIPFTVLLDGEGNIIAKKIEGKDLDAKLSEILDK